MTKSHLVRVANHLPSLLLALLLGGCSDPASPSVPPAADPAPGTPSEATEVPAKSPEKMVFEGPGKLLPKKVLDLDLSSAPRYFGPDNLFDLINGGAEIYAEYGLTKMVTADYRSDARKDKTVTLEIYDQGSPLGAFGRTARFLAGRVDPSGAGEGLPAQLVERGLFGGTDVVFWKDRFLVHVTLLDESPDATLDSMKAASRELLPAFAAAVAGGILDNPPLPAILGSFPETGRIRRSEAWETKDVGGVGGLGAGFTVRYAEGDASFTLFASDELADEASASTRAAELAGKAGDKAGLVAAGKRVIGFTSTDDGWADADSKRAGALLEELKKKLVTPR